MFSIYVWLFTIFLQIIVTHMYTHQKPLEEKLWNERCLKNSVVLNDCNWCRCNERHKYDCKARVCEEVDMFGHFKDAIQEIDVGMEGRGSWRSRQSYCTPGVQYRRGGTICICDEDGNWPNPVCRDLFQILHSVEIAGQTRLSKNESCSPTKLYLVGCNVCFCPSSGYLNPDLCTKKECQEDDPILETNTESISQQNENKTEEILEIYAACDPKNKYKLGCRTCDCLRNNRLLCSNCTLKEKQNDLSERSKYKKTNTFCSRIYSYKLFNIDCNLCYCRKQKLYCTVKTCINTRETKLKSKLRSKLIPMVVKFVDTPPNDENCVPGTTYMRNCNTCVCGRLRNGVRAVDCTRNSCTSRLKDVQKTDCVAKTYYEIDCMICLCYVKDNVKHQICRYNVECVKSKSFANYIINNKETDVELLRGRCQPMRKYKEECNVCRCLPDGIIMSCKTEFCTKRSIEALSVDLVPIRMNNLDCAKGHSFKLDCNLCFCLSNGNAICTTENCYSNQFIL